MFNNKFKLRSCEIGPNYQLDDAWVALKSIGYSLVGGLQSSLKINNPNSQLWLDKSKKNLLKTLELDNLKNNLYFVDSGRTGLYLILKSLNLSNNDEVLIQAFSCVVVPNSVLQAGLKPIICDIDINTFNFSLASLEALVTPNTKVLIWQYSFGLTQDMTQILEFCKQRNLVLIEDVAHALGAKALVDNKLKLVGTIGSASSFSFGRDKIISTTGGGSVWLNRDVLTTSSQDKFAMLFDELKPMSAWLARRNLLAAILFPCLIRPLYNLRIGALLLLFIKSIKLLPKVYSETEKEGTNIIQASQFSPILARLLYHQTTKLAYYNKHRKDIAKIYCQEFGQAYLPDSVYLRFPLNLSIFPSKIPLAKIKASLRQEGFVVSSNWYNSIFLPNKADLNKFNYQSHLCPQAEKLIQDKILNLPTNINLNLDQARDLSIQIKQLYMAAK